jgi:hypothetical protein
MVKKKDKKKQPKENADRSSIQEIVRINGPYNMFHDSASNLSSTPIE